MVQPVGPGAPTPQRPQQINLNLGSAGPNQTALRDFITDQVFSHLPPGAGLTGVEVTIQGGKVTITPQGSAEMTFLIDESEVQTAIAQKAKELGLGQAQNVRVICNTFIA